MWTFVLFGRLQRASSLLQIELAGATDSGVAPMLPFVVAPLATPPRTLDPCRCRLYPAPCYYASETIKASRSQTRLTLQPLVWFSPVCYLLPFPVAFTSDELPLANCVKSDVCPCIIYEIDERYPLDATIYLLLYITLYVSGIYMPIFKSFRLYTYYATPYGVQH